MSHEDSGTARPNLNLLGKREPESMAATLLVRSILTEEAV